MNPELVIKFMSQDLPWSFGIRASRKESQEVVAEASLTEFPFFATKGPDGHQFTAIGDDLEECLQECLEHPLLAQTIDAPEKIVT